MLLRSKECQAHCWGGVRRALKGMAETGYNPGRILSKLSLSEECQVRC